MYALGAWPRAACRASRTKLNTRQPSARGPPGSIGSADRPIERRACRTPPARDSRGMTQRSFLTVSATMLAVAALAAPVWASDEDDEDGGNDSPPVTQEAPAPQPTPFVQAPAPVSVPQTAPAPAVLVSPPSAPAQPRK